MKQIPHYLLNKLTELDIHHSAQVTDKNYVSIFAQLKTLYPSLNYRALFDLYSIALQCDYPEHEIQQQLMQHYKLLPPQHAPLDDAQIKHYLSEAYKLAEQAFALNEIPIGAIVVQDNKIIGSGYNQTKTHNDILAHAEIVALTVAQKALANHRLADCDLYVTIEPCLMCSGAIINSRIRRVFFAATEPKTGACISQYEVFNNKIVNHNTQVLGPLAPSMANILKEFLTTKRR